MPVGMYIYVYNPFMRPDSIQKVNQQGPRCLTNSREEFPAPYKLKMLLLYYFNVGTSDYGCINILIYSLKPSFGTMDSTKCSHSFGRNESTISRSSKSRGPILKALTKLNSGQSR